MVDAGLRCRHPCSDGVSRPAAKPGRRQKFANDSTPGTPAATVAGNRRKALNADNEHDVEGGLIQILIFAAIAAFVFFRLFSVLGRRTGHERRQPPLGSRGDNAEPGVADGARRDEEAEEEAVPEAPALAGDAAGAADTAMAAGLAQLRRADQSFDLDGFMAGARTAFEAIIDAFHKGDLEAVRPWLDDDVHRSFSRAIDERERTPERTRTQLLGIDRCEAVDVGMAGRQARIAVRFESEQTEVVEDGEGRIVAGDPTAPLKVVDLWTFARDTRSRDPNWRLIATRGGTQ